MSLIAQATALVMLVFSLISAPQQRHLKTPVIVREMLTYCMLNGFCRPDFIAYNCQFSNTLPVEMLRYFYKCKMAAWTIKNQGELNRHRKQFDVFIFDSFEPDQFVNFNKKHPKR